MTRSLAAVLVALAACGQDAAPDRPSWQVDVMPLFAANCVRCHAYPFRGEGATALRLDSFDDTELADGNIATGASKSVQAIFRHTHGIALLPGQRLMPPDRPLDEYELAVIRNWASLGNGETAIRGPGRPDNQVPEITLTELARDAESITFAYDVRDPDRDLVVGTVLGPRVREDLTIDPRAVVGNVIAGRGAFAVDLAGVPAGDHAIAARLDDGADIDPEGSEDFVEIELGTISIP